jgi:AcrR family transcriptional regulator
MAARAQDRPTGRRRALPRDARERLVLDTAEELFYARGVRSVGMDELVRCTGLAKASVYRLFPTKDALVTAYLRRLCTGILAAVDADLRAHADSPGDGLRAVLDAVARDLARPGFRGCPFHNASIDYDDPEHPVRVAARDYRRELRERLRGTASRLPRGAELGEQLAVLVDGAYVSAAHLGSDGPARHGLALARQLVAAAERTGPGGLPRPG